MEYENKSKPTVLLVHGMWSDQNTMHEVQNAFVEQGFPVEALCLPYHCTKAEHTLESKKQLAQTRLQDYVEYIIEQVRRQESPPILVGHSMGGLLVQLVAAQVPCSKLILLSSAAPAGINGLSLSVIRTLGRNMLRFPLWLKVTEVELNNVMYGIANSQGSEVQQDIYEHSTYESGMATFQITMGLVLGERSAAYVHSQNIQCPVLIIGGTSDRITPITIQRKIAERFGDRSLLVEIPGCCHWTVGGKYFPQIRSKIFNWLNE
jgi:alpha-beta hydrolase superfamily lysophospholipase